MLFRHVLRRVSSYKFKCMRRVIGCASGMIMMQVAPCATTKLSIADQTQYSLQRRQPADLHTPRTGPFTHSATITACIHAVSRATQSALLDDRPHTSRLRITYIALSVVALWEAVWMQPAQPAQLFMCAAACRPDTPPTACASRTDSAATRRTLRVRLCCMMRAT